jgi:hypothetical protein
MDIGSIFLGLSCICLFTFVVQSAAVLRSVAVLDVDVVEEILEHEEASKDFEAQVLSVLMMRFNEFTTHSMYYTLLLSIGQEKD